MDETLKKSLDEISKEIKDNTAKLKSELQTASEDKQKELISKFETAQEALAEKHDEAFAKIEKERKEQQDHIDSLDKKLQDKKAEKSAMSFKAQFRESLKENLIDNQKAEQLQKSGTQHEFIFKVVGDMTSGNVTTAITDEYVPGFLEAGVNRVAKRPTFIQSLINTGFLSNTRTVTWYEQTTSEGAVATRAENAIMGQVDYDWARKQAALKFISGYTKITNEALLDLSWLMSEINFELFRDIELKLDEQLLNGGGTGEDLTGIITEATAWAAGNHAVLVPTPTNADVLRVAINQIILANHMPNYIVMNPDDVTTMDVDKASDGHYILPPFSSAGNTIIKGLPIIQNTGIAAGDFLVMDGTRSTAFFREGITVRIWDQNDTDPIYNRKTVTANVEALQRIKGNDKTAFVTGTFSTAVTALTLP